MRRSAAIPRVEAWSCFLDPQAWLSFLTLSVLEVVLGIDNIIFLAILVDRLPEARRRSARYLGLSFAAITRIALLLSVVWLTRLRAPLFRWFDEDVSVRDLALLGGGILLVVQSVKEIRDMLRHRTARRETGSMRGYWLIIAQVGVIDIVFSFDTVFTAVGLSNQVEVMVAAILVSVAVMMAVSAGWAPSSTVTRRSRPSRSASWCWSASRCSPSRCTSRFPRVTCISRWRSQGRWSGSTSACDARGNV